MSQFTDKVKNGQVPSDSDWNQYLVEAHKLAPSMTPKAFASYKTAGGLTSYEILANSIDGIVKPSTILDLACGDGYLFQFLAPKLAPDGQLIGVDMSEGELAVAKKVYAKDKRIKLQNAMAQSLPLADRSVEAIVCHMAFMLMLPLDPVVSEIARVLKSGGIFSAVVGNAKEKGGLFAEIQKITSQFIDQRYSKFHEIRSGDPRVQNESGIRELFSPKNGFLRQIDFLEIPLLIQTDPQGVWQLMKDMYFVSMLSDDEKSQLKNELISFAESEAESSETVSFEFHMKMFVVRKA